MTLKQVKELAQLEQEIQALHAGTADYEVRQEAIAILKNIRDGLVQYIKAGSDPVKLREIA